MHMSPSLLRIYATSEGVIFLLGGCIEDKAYVCSLKFVYFELKENHAINECIFGNELLSIIISSC